MTADHVSIKVTIRGRVQGVWYRGWTVREARRLGLDGWVGNCPDGSVQAVFSGPAPRVRAMIDRCRTGPPAARVESLVESPFTAAIEPGFRQITPGDSGMS